MRRDTLDHLRCPFCGGRLALAESAFHRADAQDISDGILGCHCCAFPIVAGIPVLHLEPASHEARGHLEAGRPDLALRALVGLIDDGQAARFEAAAHSDRSTYRDVVEALGPDFEGGYFLYRFSDPTYVVADAVVRAVAGTVLQGGGRALDLCGGSGHLTRVLADVSQKPPFLADLYFSKLWLARRFTAPSCEAVCCDGNAPLPFADATFRFAVCSDAFHYVWTKRLFAYEMMRVVDARGALAVSHTHNALQWNPSAGMPLPPDAYEELFAAMQPRLYAESRLRAEIVAGGPLDLGRSHPASALAEEPALTLVASRDPRVFARHALAIPSQARGEFRVSPLYEAERSGDRVTLRLRFPSADYEQEYVACRAYLPAEIVVPAAAIDALAAGRVPPALADLVRRRVVLDLPARYY